MRIAVNARMLSQNKPSGIRKYAHETLKRITKRHPEHDFLFILDRPFSGKGFFPGNVAFTGIFPSFHPFLWYPWFEWAVPRILKNFGADLFLSADGFASLSTPVAEVLVIHDLGFNHNPIDLPLSHRRYYNRFFPCTRKRRRSSPLFPSIRNGTS